LLTVLGKANAAAPTAATPMARLRGVRAGMLEVIGVVRVVEGYGVLRLIFMRKKKLRPVKRE
jgi:hypothetical protein